MKTVYDAITGEPVALNPVDARERVAAGLATLEPPAADILPAATKGAEPGGMGADAPCPPDAPPSAAPPSRTGGEAMTIKELRAALHDRGVQFPSAAPKGDLVALFDALP